jgi:hypothetical protein
MLKENGLDEATFDRFRKALGIKGWRFEEHWAGDRYCILRAWDARGEWRSYRAHDIRMLAARC